MEKGLEYLFFTQTIKQQFVHLLQQRNLPFSETVESVQGAYVLRIERAVDDALWDELDDLFDTLSEQDQQLLESGMEDETAASTAGIYLQLTNGGQTIAQVDPDVMNRILSVVSMDELNTFLDVVVRSVEAPNDSAICRK